MHSGQGRQALLGRYLCPEILPLIMHDPAKRTCLTLPPHFLHSQHMGRYQIPRCDRWCCVVLTEAFHTVMFPEYNRCVARWFSFWWLCRTILES